jgi:hypothetical protein
VRQSVLNPILRVRSAHNQDLCRDLDGEADGAIRSCRAPGTIGTATLPSPSKSQLPDAMKALPSDVKVIFCTCFPIAARAIRGSEFSNLRKSRCRTSTNLRVSRMHDLTASGCELTIVPATVSSSRSNSHSLAMRNPSWQAMGFLPQFHHSRQIVSQSHLQQSPAREGIKPSYLVSLHSGYPVAHSIVN